MYYDDLSDYEYGPEALDEVQALNVGWLDAEHAFPKGTPSKEFVDALFWFCSHPVVQHRGGHTCEFCDPTPNLGPLLVTHCNRSIWTSYQIFPVFGENGKIYLSPDLIFHYVTQHHYSPPAEYIDAVLNGPRPGSREYARLVRSFVDPSDIVSRALMEASETAARFGYIVDIDINHKRMITDQEFDDHPEQSTEDLLYAVKYAKPKTSK